MRGPSDPRHADLCVTIHQLLPQMDQATFLSKGTFPQIGGKSWVTRRTVGKLIIGSEFDVNGSRRVADDIRALGNQFEQVAIASCAV